jgi:hypothetical protein
MTIEAHKLRVIITLNDTTSVIQHAAHRIAIRWAQFGNEMSDLGDHRFHPAILPESDSGATFVSRATNR